MKSALLLIEFQNEWLSEEGKLNFLMKDKQLLKTSEVNAARVLSIARKRSLPIIHSGLMLSSDYQELSPAESGLRHHIPKARTFVAGEFGSNFAAGFEPENNEFVVSGRTGSSAFASSNLDNYLRANDIKKLFIMGYALQVCVESTFRAGHDLGYEVCVIHDACAAFDQFEQQYFLDHVVSHFGTAISSDEFEHLG